MIIFKLLTTSGPRGRVISPRINGLSRSMYAVLICVSIPVVCRTVMNRRRHLSDHPACHADTSINLATGKKFSLTSCAHESCNERVRLDKLLPPAFGGRGDLIRSVYNGC